MATREIERLRLTYIGAYSAYLSCLHKISTASQRGEKPTEQLLRQELASFSDFVSAREELMRALRSTP